MGVAPRVPTVPLDQDAHAFGDLLFGRRRVARPWIRRTHDVGNWVGHAVPAAGIVSISGGVASISIVSSSGTCHHFGA